jgi:hypothetical protein
MLEVALPSRLTDLALVIGPTAFPLEEVSTVRGSGWVDDQHAILLLILKPEP